VSFPKDFKGELWEPKYARAKHKEIQLEVRVTLRDECEKKISALEKTMRAEMKSLPAEQFEEIFDHSAMALVPSSKRWVQTVHREWQKFRRQPQDPELIAVDTFDPDVPAWSEGQTKKPEPVPANSWLHWPLTHALLKRNRDQGFRTITGAGPGQ